MKTEASEKTVEKLREISAARKAAGRSDWASQYVLAPLVDKAHKKECGND